MKPYPKRAMVSNLCHNFAKYGRLIPDIPERLAETQAQFLKLYILKKRRPKEEPTQDLFLDTYHGTQKCNGKRHQQQTRIIDQIASSASQQLHPQRQQWVV